MKKVLFLAVCVLLLLKSLILFAEENKDNFKPVYATVCTDRVNIRAGRGVNFEVLGQISKLDTLVVLAEELGWYKIRLPKGTSCFVDKRFIDHHVVRANKLRVRAGQGDNFNILGALEMGDTVDVLEEDGEWLKIVPPKHCVGWVKKDYLKLTPEEFRQPILKTGAQTVLPNKKIAVSGLVDDLGKIANRPGTHKLIVDKQSCYCLKAENINLNQYVYQRVDITGTLLEPKDFPYPVLQVEQIKLKQ